MNGWLLLALLVVPAAGEATPTATAKPDATAIGKPVATALAKPPAIATAVSPIAAPPTGAPEMVAATDTSAVRPAAVARPAWLKQPTGLRGDGRYVMHVNAGPAFSRTDCEPKLKAEIERRLRQYIDELVPAGTAGVVPIDVDRLWGSVVTEEWEERVAGENAELVFLHVELRIDQKLRQAWKDQAIELVRAGRTRLVMLGYAAAIGAAAAAFMLIKWSGSRAGRRRAGLLPAAGLVAIIVAVAAIWTLVRSA